MIPNTSGGDDESPSISRHTLHPTVLSGEMCNVTAMTAPGRGGLTTPQRQRTTRRPASYTIRLVLAFITSRLDYCNSVLAGLLQATLEPLQRVQNAAVQLIFQLGRREHITPGLCQLHWLPIRWRIQFKLCTIMHSVHTGRCPAYLADCVQTVASSSSHSGQRSATSSRFVSPRLRTKFGERAFSYAGPVAWNSLPADIRDETDSTAFRKLLKTHYFNMTFKSS